jgi:cytidylate kinase
LIQKGQQVNEADILQEIKERDYRDEHREVAPAVAAADTIRLNGNQELSDLINEALTVIRERIGS